jgi:Zn-dependent peptidase ImmA (M78 family)
MVYLPEATIKSEAEKLLRAYEKSHGIVRNRVPIDHIVEQYLKIHLEAFDDSILPKIFKGQILGYVDVKNRTIGIHNSIFPEISEKTGRYVYTLGHEVGHLILHEEQILSNSEPFNCFEQDDSASNPLPSELSSMEWQAENFSAYFVMPENLIMQEWKTQTGAHSQLTINHIIQEFSDKNKVKYPPDVLAQIWLKKMAESMGVSQKALFKRLRNMGLITGCNAMERRQA